MSTSVKLRTLFIPALFLAVFAFANSSSASTIQFGSFAGASSSNFANGVVTYQTYNDSFNTFAPVGAAIGSGNASTTAIASLPNLSATGSSLLSFDAGTYTTGDPIATTVYSTTYAGSLLGDTGSLVFEADDTVTAYLNGTLLGTTNGFPNTLTAFSLPASALDAGNNVFTFDVTNSGGPTSLEFAGSAAAATPEPGTLITVGIGILGLAGTLRRRFAA